MASVVALVGCIGINSWDKLGRSLEYIFYFIWGMVVVDVKHSARNGGQSSNMELTCSHPF